jgi:hypothetical protein
MPADQTVPSRPCRYCIANWVGMSNRVPGRTTPPILPTATDCEWEHRDDPRVYGLARAISKAIQGAEPTDEQIAWFLGDADDVVDDFDPTPDLWRVTRLSAAKTDGERGIDVRLRINRVAYVALAGGKDCRGSVMKLSVLRQQEREANRD